MALYHNFAPGGDDPGAVMSRAQRIYREGRACALRMSTGGRVALVLAAAGVAVTLDEATQLAHVAPRIKRQRCA